MPKLLILDKSQQTSFEDVKKPQITRKGLGRIEKSTWTLEFKEPPRMISRETLPDVWTSTTTSGTSLQSSSNEITYKKERIAHRKNKLYSCRIIPVTSDTCCNTLPLSNIISSVFRLMDFVYCLRRSWRTGPRANDKNLESTLNSLVDRLEWLKKDLDFTSGTCDQLGILIEVYDKCRTKYEKLKKTIHGKRKTSATKPFVHSSLKRWKYDNS